MKIALGCGIAGVFGLIAILIAVIAVGIWASRHAKTTGSDRPSSSGAAEPQAPGGTTAPRSASRYVVIDAQESAYTVYSAFPAENLPQVRQQNAGQAGTEIVDWDTFREDAESRIKSRIERYDGAPASQFVPQIIELIDSTGGPIGVTWNGGVAITYGDYQAAKRAYERAR
jgi:hypothetical protein